MACSKIAKIIPFRFPRSHKKRCPRRRRRRDCGRPQSLARVLDLAKLRSRIEYFAAARNEVRHVGESVKS